MSGSGGLGAVVRAFAALQPDELTSARVAALLGYDLTAPRRPSPVREARAFEPPVASETAVVHEPVTRTRRREGAAVVAPAPRPEAASHQPWRRYLRPARLEWVARRGGEQGLPAAPTAGGPPPPVPPLLAPRTASRHLETIVATDAADGEVDLEQTVAALAARERVSVLPRLGRPSLLRGVQVLMDVSSAMAPFHADAEQVRRVLRASVGPARVRALDFDGAPLADTGVGQGSVWNWRPYVPPAHGTPVLALAELGLANVPGRIVADIHDDWLAFGELLGRRGSPLIVLTPFGPSRWPRRLARQLRIVRWDRAERARAR